MVYLCPLNHNNNHFTWLEINEREGKIRHYDSRANKGVIDGKVKLTRVGKLVQVSHFFSNRNIDPADVTIAGVWPFENLNILRRYVPNRPVLLLPRLILDGRVAHPATERGMELWRKGCMDREARDELSLRWWLARRVGS